MMREQLFRYFFLAVLLILLYEVLHILSPFYTGILGAVILALMFYPLHRLILKVTTPRRPNWAASMSVVLVIVLIIIPFTFLSWFLFNELSSFSSVIKHFVNTLVSWRNETGTQPHWFQLIETKLAGILGISEARLQNFAVDLAEHVIQKGISFGKAIPAQAFKLFINLAIMIFTLFFLFRDGQNIFRKFKELIPMDTKHKDQITAQLYLTMTAVVQGIFLVAIVQGSAAAAGFYIAKVPSPMILGFITVFTSVIPFVGAPAVWLPVTIYYLIQGFIGKGIFLLLWGFFVVSLIDNVIRIYVVGTKAKLPILFLFFGILGGAKVYGPKGFFLGPLVVALVLAFIRIYREVYTQDSKEIQ